MTFKASTAVVHGKVQSMAVAVPTLFYFQAHLGVQLLEGQLVVTGVKIQSQTLFHFIKSIFSDKFFCSI